MIEKVTDALVLKSKDFKDNDKIVYLFSPTEGKISAVLKGVKKASAKMKFAGEPFCFAEFTYVKRGDMATVTNCFERESFFELRTDIERFYCGTAVLETASIFVQENIPAPQLFVTTVKTLQLLTEQQLNPKTILIKYLLLVLQIFGQKLNFDVCNDCGEKLNGQAFFNFEVGGTICKDCANMYSFAMDESIRKVICNIDTFDIDRLCNYKCSDVLLKKTLLFFSTIFADNFKKINSINQLIEL